MQTKQKKRQLLAEESIESKARNAAPEPTTFGEETKNLWDDMLKSTGRDVFGGSLTSASEQLLGASGSESQLVEGQQMVLKAENAQGNTEKTSAQTVEFLEYKRSVVNTERIGDAKTEIGIKSAIERIQVEIRNLSQTSKLVERTVKDATAERSPVKPGKYHLSFFEFVLGVLRDATRKLEDTVHFGAVFTSKKQQSKYWNSYKKHGTQFGLSGERTTATQTG